MRFTLMGFSAGIIGVVAGASPWFMPALLIIGYGVDRNLRKDKK